MHASEQKQREPNGWGKFRMPSLTSLLAVFSTYPLPARAPYKPMASPPSSPPQAVLPTAGQNCSQIMTNFLKCLSVTQFVENNIVRQICCSKFKY